MADEEIKYETRTVKTIRGAESRTASKWEQQGWEVVSQTTGKLSAQLTIRRPKPKTPWRWIAVGGGAFVIALTAITVIGVVNDQNNLAAPVETPATVAIEPSAKSTTPAAAPSPEPTSAEAVAPTITTASDPAFAAILALGDYCSPDIAAFAAEHAGQTIEFDANIGAMNSHNGASTRYDILLGAGDFSETSATGPAFQFRDVNTTSDLHYVGDVPDGIGVRDNLNVTAEILNYEPSSCLFLLEPVATSFR